MKEVVTNTLCDACFEESRSRVEATTLVARAGADNILMAIDLCDQHQREKSIDWFFYALMEYGYEPQEVEDQPKKRGRPRHNPGEYASPIPCSLCSEIFSNSESKKRHVKAQHADEAIKCPECGDLFDSEKGLTRHNQMKHKDTITFVPSN